MFHSLYITTESGVCIFAQHFIESRIDNQLITGFINALGAFATEALGSEMQSLKLQTGEQLAILRYTGGQDPLIGIVVADARDNSVLIRNLLKQILVDFYTIFKQKLDYKRLASVVEFEEFKYNVDSILEERISPRTNLKMIIGLLVGIFLMGTILIAFIPLFIEMSKVNIAEFGLENVIFDDFNGLSAAELETLQIIVFVVIAAITGFTCVVFLLPTFIAAYIAGNKKRGIWTALLLGASVGLVLIFSSFFSETFMEINGFLWFLVFSPLLISLALLCGIYGGRLKERRKLYPLEGYREQVL